MGADVTTPQASAPDPPPAAAAPGPAPVIRTQGLSKRYDGRTVVDRLSLEVAPGEIFGLLGPNGAGKTTTILMLLGLTERSAGTAEVVGLDPARNPLQVKRRVGYLPDNVGFYPTLTGRENLRYTARLNGMKGGAVEQHLDELLAQVGLTDAADRAAGNYSRGMRQRLGIADALVKDPDVAILDEPTIAIDPEGVAEILELIRSLARERGVAVLLSSHLLHQVQSVCDRVGIFVAGRMVAVGRTAELAAQLETDEVVVEVAVDGSADEAARILSAVPSVLSVMPDPRDPALLVVTMSSDERPAVVGALTLADLGLRHLRRRGEELDEIYRRWFASADAPARQEAADVH